jgi:hypothetical protein
MSRQYFMDTLADPPIADLAAWATITTDTMLWTPSVWTPIPAGDTRPGKMYKVSAGGIITLPAATGSLTLTPRVGPTTTVASSPTLGASGAQFSSGATTNRPWWLELLVVVRTIAVTGGATSTMMAWGTFETQGVLSTGGASMNLVMGGTSAVFDASLAQGIGVSAIWGTTAGSITPQFACIQSMN